LQDKYHNFADLISQEQESRDFERIAIERRSRLAVVVPHGGSIEPGTSEIGRAIAADDFSLYCFEGLKTQQPEDLHITSHHFDDPLCLKIVRSAWMVVAIHGCTGSHPVVHAGGLHLGIKNKVIEALYEAGFDAQAADQRHSGTNRSNICNQGISTQGLQMEITEGLRQAMFAGLDRKSRQITTPAFARFVAAVRSVLVQVQSENEDM